MAPRHNNRLLADMARHEAQQLIRMVAEPIPTGERAKTSIARVSTILEWPYARAEDVWHADARRIDSWEMDMLRSVIRNRLRRTRWHRNHRKK